MILEEESKSDKHFILGQLFYTGEARVDKDLLEARNQFYQSYRLGNLKAGYNFALMVYNKEGDDPDEEFFDKKELYEIFLESEKGPVPSDVHYYLGKCASNIEIKKDHYINGSNNENPKCAYELGLIYYNEKHFQKAEEKFVLVLDESIDSNMIENANFFREICKAEQGKEICQEVLEKFASDEWSTAYYWLGVFHQKREDNEDALYNFEKCLENDYRTTEVREKIFEIYLDQRKWEDAEIIIEYFSDMEVRKEMKKRLISEEISKKSEKELFKWGVSCYHNGDPIAFTIFDELCEKRQVLDSYYWLANCYIKEVGCEKDIQRAISLLKTYHDYVDEDNLAANSLYELFSKDEYGVKDEKEAIYWGEKTGKIPIKVQQLPSPPPPSESSEDDFVKVLDMSDSGLLIS